MDPAFVTSMQTRKSEVIESLNMHTTYPSKTHGHIFLANNGSLFVTFTENDTIAPEITIGKNTMTLQLSVDLSDDYESVINAI